ncbi:response regulator transcription factor [Methylocystis parvus]|uniref:Response regulator transcription factor n=1 Tax=Methylocystis parvus TaxID=134 RepID=A0A6B8M6S1_9HYPH|nr:LuxR C-terminal-related transcriptional regulator [Methylocystis parvus]QGM98188.1 response regulator transcription factor [Methylocystis parvus]WBK01487.1 LuxR C-terminal-related transcriptional regulator [Methylocystis parvus OBBP]
MPTVSVIAENSRERNELAKLLSREGVVVDVFSEISAFLQNRREAADCLVLDLDNPCDVTRSLFQLRDGDVEAPPVVVLSPRAAVSLAVHAMKAGAADFLEKPIDASRLLGAVRAAIEASRPRSERARRKRDLIARYHTLSARERDVVGAVLGGRGNREVASQLGIKLRTVETHRSNAMNKLGARTLPDLVKIWHDIETEATP